MFSISLPSRVRNARPSAVTTPVETVDWNPNGLPTAMTSCPTRSDAESPIEACGSPEPSARITARSVAGSTPATAATSARPSASVTVSPRAPATT